MPAARILRCREDLECSHRSYPRLVTSADVVFRLGGHTVKRNKLAANSSSCRDPSCVYGSYTEIVTIPIVADTVLRHAEFALRPFEEGLQELERVGHVRDLPLSARLAQEVGGSSLCSFSDRVFVIIKPCHAAIA